MAWRRETNGRAPTPRYKVVGWFLISLGWVALIPVIFSIDLDDRARAAMVERGWDEFGWAVSLVSFGALMAPLMIVSALGFVIRKPVTRLTDRSPSLSRMFDRIADRWDRPRGMCVRVAARFLVFFTVLGLFNAFFTLDGIGTPVDAAISFVQFPLIGCLLLFWRGAIRIGATEVCARCEYPIDRSVNRPCPECGADLSKPHAVAVGRLWDTRARAALWWVSLALFVGTIWFR